MKFSLKEQMIIPVFIPQVYLKQKIQILFHLSQNGMKILIQEMNQETSQEMNREMNQEINQEMNGEMNKNLEVIIY